MRLFLPLACAANLAATSREGGSGEEPGWGVLQRTERPRRVVLAPVVIDAVDETLEAMLAPASAVMAGRPKAHAGIGHEISKRGELSAGAGA